MVSRRNGLVCGLAVMQNGTLEVRKASRVQELRCSLNRRRSHCRKVVSLEVWTLSTENYELI